MAEARRVLTAVLDVCETPEEPPLRGKGESQLVRGEIFFVEEERQGRSYGTCAHDGYKGWVETRALAPADIEATHSVAAQRSHAYRAPSLKAPAAAVLSFGSRLAISAHENGFAQAEDGLWLWENHLAPIGETEPDYLSTALKFIETPYYWGGRSGLGVDCSGLVQICLARAGIAAPRDTAQQETALGTPAETPSRGDLVFFKGHVGFMLDDTTLLHANAFHMKTVAEPLACVTARGSAMTSVRKVL